MRQARLVIPSSSTTLERLATLRWIRFGLGPVTVGMALLSYHVRGDVPGKDFLLITVFAAVLVTSVFGGFWPGAFATLLSVVLAPVTAPGLLDRYDLLLLGTEGMLLSLVGGTLRRARRNARERLVANLQLEQQILEIGDEERRRIGHDLHDGLGQHLTGISLLSETMSQQMAAGKTPEPENVETITRLVSQAVQITRDLARTLSPVTLERDGFVAAIEELANTTESLLGIECEADLDDQGLVLDRTRSLHLLRIVQEAVNNSVKHGKARRVIIRVCKEGSKMKLTVSDDGSGLSHKTITNPGLGLRIMQYRARMLDAELAVARATDKGGTVVTCICPIGKDHNDPGAQAIQSSPGG